MGSSARIWLSNSGSMGASVARKWIALKPWEGPTRLPVTLIALISSVFAWSSGKQSPGLLADPPHSVNVAGRPGFPLGCASTVSGRGRRRQPLLTILPCQR